VMSVVAVPTTAFAEFNKLTVALPTATPLELTTYPVMGFAALPTFRFAISPRTSPIRTLPGLKLTPPTVQVLVISPTAASARISSSMAP